MRLLSQIYQPQDIVGKGRSGNGGDWEVGVGRKSKVTVAACVIEQKGLCRAKLWEEEQWFLNIFATSY